MHLLVGPIGSGKSDRVMARVVEAHADRLRPALIVVPSAPAVRIARGRLKLMLGNLSPPSAVSFLGLCMRLLRSGGWSGRILDRRDQESFVAAAVRDLASAGRLTYFRSIIDRPGLIASLATFIDELWQSGTDPRTFARAAKRPKEHDIAAIFQRYAALLDGARMVDRGGAAHAALMRLEGGAVPRLPRLVAADGFDAFSSLQVSLLDALSGLGVEVMATLDYEESRSVHLWHEPTMVRFNAAGARIERVSSRPDSVLTQAASGLLAEGPTLSAPPSRGGSITVVCAPDRAAEVRAVAREIKRLVLYEGYHPTQVSVVCRSLQPYAHHLSWVFSDWGIPLSLHSRRNLSSVPLASSVVRLITLAASRFPRRAVLDLLRSPYFDFTQLDLDQASIDLLDHLSLFYKVLRSREQWEEAIEAASRNLPNRPAGPPFSDHLGVSPGELTAQLSLLGKRLAKFFDAVTPQEASPMVEHCEWLLRLLGVLRVEEIAGGHANDAQTFRSLVDVARRLSGRESTFGEFEEDRAVSSDSFSAGLERGIESTIIRLAQPSSAVTARALHAGDPRRFRAVFVLGLIEGEFPARITQTFPLTPAERDELRCAGIDLRESQRDAGCDLFQFYKTVGRTTEKLYLCYPRTDLTGGELIHSYLIDEVKRAAPVEEIRIATGEALSGGATLASAGSFGELALLTARALRDARGEPSDIEAACRLLQRELPSWTTTLRAASVERRRLAGATADAFGGMVAHPDLTERMSMELGPSRAWSATQINDYGICPFRFFARHVLRLESADEPVEGFLARQIGAAYHHVLERVYSTLTREGVEVALDASQTELADADRLTDIVDRASTSVLEDMFASGEIRKEVLSEFEKNEIGRRIMRLLRAEAGWNRRSPSKPIELEMRFGSGGVPPLIVTAGKDQVRIRGVIDRIDKREDGLVVIDYKTAASPISYRDAYEGRNLQLPIYLMAVEQVIRPGQPVAGGYYLHINSARKGSEIRRGGAPDQSLGSILARSREFIRDYAGRARSGQFPVRPNGPCPAYCEYNVMCRIKSLRTSIMKEHE